MINTKSLNHLSVLSLSMTKRLELVGFALIGGTIVSFVGMPDSELRWPVFWGCAIGALAIIIYRKRQKKKQDQNLSK